MNALSPALHSNPFVKDRRFQIPLLRSLPGSFTTSLPTSRFTPVPLFVISVAFCETHPQHHQPRVGPNSDEGRSTPPPSTNWPQPVNPLTGLLTGGFRL